jgi:hypothetical protein
LNQEKTDIEKLKHEMEMDHQMRMNKKNNYINDAKIYYNEEFNKKKRMEEMKLNERFSKNETSIDLKSEERREEYRKKLLRMNEMIEKNAGSFLDFNSNKDSIRFKYGNKELYQHMRNNNNISNLIFNIFVLKFIN